MNMSDKNHKKTNPLASITGILGTLIIILVIVAMLPLTIPKIMGYQTYDVVSGSMEPEIPVGSLVLVKPASPSDIEVNDVIAFTSDKDGGAVITHRVIEIDKDGASFITKGDANEQKDMNPVSFGNLVGRVEKHYPALGSIMAVLAGGMGKIYLLMILAAGVLLNLISAKLK